MSKYEYISEEESEYDSDPSSDYVPSETESESESENEDESEEENENEPEHEHHVSSRCRTLYACMMFTTVAIAVGNMYQQTIVNFIESNLNTTCFQSFIQNF